MTDPTITIAGLEARIGVLSEALYIANRGRADLSTDASKLDARLGAMESERDALAAQLAEVRAEMSRRATDGDGRVSAICRALGIDESGNDHPVDAIEAMRVDIEMATVELRTAQRDLASERAHLAACKTRIAGLEQAADERSKEVARLTDRIRWLGAARSALVDVADDLRVDAGDSVDSDLIATKCGAAIGRLTARVAELEARPVLTEEKLRAALYTCADDRAVDKAGDIMAKLVPATLPAQDTAAQIVRVYIAEHAKIAEQVRAGDFSWHPEMCNGLWHTEVGAAIQQAAMSRALASLGAAPITPTAAPVDRAAAERVVRAYHDSVRSPTCPASELGTGEWNRAVDAMSDALASLCAPPTTPPAARPVFAGVSEEELCSAYNRGCNDNPADRPRINGIRAVLARLEVSLVAPVDPEAVAAAILAAVGGSSEAPAKEWKAATKACRTTLTAAGIPVTPEVGK